ncbi:MAG: hypothetical protein J6L77_04030 [Coprococcus sp.]|nr:hypothetical protein [Coprococcus sp.]
MFSQIAVIGAGTMETGVSSDLLLHGHEVILVDISQEQLKQARHEIRNVIRRTVISKKSKRIVCNNEGTAD